MAARYPHSSLHPTCKQTTLQGTHFLKRRAFFSPYYKPHNAAKGERISLYMGQHLKSSPLEEGMFQMSS